MPIIVDCHENYERFHQLLQTTNHLVDFIDKLLAKTSSAAKEFLRLMATEAANSLHYIITFPSQNSLSSLVNTDIYCTWPQTLIIIIKRLIKIADKVCVYS